MRWFFNNFSLPYKEWCQLVLLEDLIGHPYFTAAMVAHLPFLSDLVAMMIHIHILGCDMGMAHQ
jgi:hypothetical protein